MTLLIFMTGSVYRAAYQDKVISEFEFLFKERFIDAAEKTHDPGDTGPSKEHFIFHNKYNNEYKKGLFAISKEIFQDSLPWELEIQNQARYEDYLYEAYNELRRNINLSDIERFKEQLHELNKETMGIASSTHSDEIAKKVEELLKYNLVVEGIRINGLQLDLYHWDYYSNDADVLFLNEIQFDNQTLNLPVHNFIHFKPGNDYVKHSIYRLFNGVVGRPRIFYRYDIPKVYLGWLKSHGIEIRTESGRLL